MPSEAHDFTIVDTAGRKLKADGYATDEPVTVSGGYGGHPTAARAKRRALTVYEGRQPFSLSVPMLLFRGVGGSVEADRRALDAMATSRALAANEHPPGVNISSLIPLPIPASILAGGTFTQPACEWWVEDLAWGEELRLPPDDESYPGHLTRKMVTVTLLERIDDELIGDRHGPWHRHYRVKSKPGHSKKPETLAEIAARELGSTNRVAEIKAHNPKIRSSGHLRIGEDIILEGTGSRKTGSSGGHEFSGKGSVKHRKKR